MITLLDQKKDAGTTPGVVKPVVDPQDDPKPERPYAVVLYNDHLNSIEYVIGILMRVFSYGFFKATRLMWEAHTRGKSIIWSGSKALAEKYAEAVRNCGPDPVTKVFGAKELTVRVEQLPE